MLLDYVLLQLPTEKVIIKNYYLEDDFPFRGPSYILKEPYTFIYPHSFLLMSIDIKDIITVCEKNNWKFRDLTGELKSL